MRVAIRVTVGVTVGVTDAVAVGAVEVGKGPSNSWAVRASAVRVLFVLVTAFPSLNEKLRLAHTIKITRAEIPRICI